jgi:LPPG:FO 2-phospho-L-lactate transferase
MGTSGAGVAVIAGGVGAARLLRGLVQVTDPGRLTAIVNVGDDFELHGLAISPDLDTITYTLAGEINPATGWGLRDESWQAMDCLERYGGATWFRLGDRDLGTHLYRTQRRRDGAPLSVVTAEITRAWDLELHLLPVTDDPLRTHVTVEDPDPDVPDHVVEREVSFQEYFVQRRHAVTVRSVRIDGAGEAKPAPGVLDALAGADRVVIAPSNPIVSVAPVLAVHGIHEALVERRTDTVAVSPIVAGAALKGPADRLLAELGHEPSVVGVARLYRDVAATLVIDEADAALAGAVEAEGMACTIAPTIMRDPAATAALARVVLDGLP